MTENVAAETYLRGLLVGLWTRAGSYSTNGVPWTEVIDLAQASGVASTLHGALARVRAAVPAAAAEILQQSYYQMAALNTLHLADLERVLEALVPVAGPLVVLKGAALAEQLYGNVALRKIGDVDLLVPPERVPACRQALQELGYVPHKVELRPGAHLRYGNEEMFVDRETGHASVELHWHLLDVPYYLQKVPLDWFWQNTEPYTVGGHAVRVLNAEANLLYLAGHLALHHQADGLRWYVDLALIVDAYGRELDWARVAARAQDFELLLAVREVLGMLATMWPSLPLAEAQRRLGELDPAPFERRLYGLLQAPPCGTIHDLYVDLVCLPNVRERFRFLWLNVFPQPAYMVQRYGVGHSWQLPYWYLYRLGDGFLKVARTARVALHRSRSRTSR